MKKSIKSWWHSYNTRELKEMREFATAFRAAILTEREKRSSQQEALALDSRFQIDNDTKLPMRYLDENIQIDVPANTYHAKLDQSEIKVALEDMISYICQYQHERVSRSNLFARGKDFDPTNMFCAEFIDWIIKLSSKSIESEKTQKAIESRIRYLKILEESSVFKPSVYASTRIKLFKDLKNCLIDRTLPVVEFAISRKSSREVIRDIKTQVSDLIKKNITFLYHCFRDSSCQSSNFILEQLISPNIEAFKVSEKTTTGMLLSRLVQAPELIRVFGKLRRSMPAILSKKVTEIPQNKVVYLPNNWFERGNSGVQKSYHSKKLMQAFLAHHNLIIEIAKIHSRFQKLYELSGEGGDLLVYGNAIINVERLISDYHGLMDKMQKNLSTLNEARQYIHDQIISENKTRSWKFGDLYQNSKVAGNKFEEIGVLVCECDANIEKVVAQSRVPIQLRIAHVNSLFQGLYEDEHHMRGQSQRGQVQATSYQLYSTPNDGFLRRHTQALAEPFYARLNSARSYSAVTGQYQAQCAQEHHMENRNSEQFRALIV